MAQASNILTKIAGISAGLGLAGSLVQSSVYTVDGGERAVLFDRFQGVLADTTGEGMHVRIPWVQTPTIFDIRTRPRSISSVTGTKDLQMVNITLRVLSKPNVDMLPTIFKNLGPEYDEKILPSIGNEVLKAVVANYNAEQLLTQRSEVSAAVRSNLTKRAHDFNILLDDVALTHLSFGDEFSRAIESKQVAQQEAERSKFVVQKSEQEKLAAVIKAEGESDAARLISEATKNAGPGLIELRRIEAAREIASTLSRGRNVVYLPSQANMLMGMNSGK